MYQFKIALYTAYSIKYFLSHVCSFSLKAYLSFVVLYFRKIHTFLYLSLASVPRSFLLGDRVVIEAMMEFRGMNELKEASTKLDKKRLVKGYRRLLDGKI